MNNNSPSPLKSLLPTLIALAIFLQIPAASAGKLYKIVDAEGNITFSQYPPAEKEENAEIQAMDKPGGGSTPITEKYGAKYCGDNRLPTFGNYNRDIMLKNIDDFRANARDQLDYQEQLLQAVIDDDQKTYESNKQRRELANQYRNSYISDNEYQRRQQEYSDAALKRNRSRREGILRNMRDLRCQVDWANNYKDEIYAMKAKASQKAGQLKQTSDRINTQMQENCGAEPYYDPSNDTSAAQWRRWKECIREYRKDLYHVDSRLYEEQRKLR